MVHQRVAAEKQTASGYPTYRHDAPLEMPDRSRAEPLYTYMLTEHKPVRRWREMIYLLAVEEPMP